MSRVEKATANSGAECFQNDAHKYAAYLETPEGQLRFDLAFANLREFLPQPVHSPCALDVGGGTGAAAVGLARLGYQVTLLDSSPAMLDIAGRAAREAGIAERITLQHSDASRVADLFRPGTFDVVLCHNILEYVDAPAAVLCSAASVMRNSSAILSVLVRNQAGEALKALVEAGDIAAAEKNLTAEWGNESLYGSRVRLFSSTSLKAMLNAASLAVIAERGVRVVADYLPQRISLSAGYERIFKLERVLGSRPEFAAISRYLHFLAHRPFL